MKWIILSVIPWEFWCKNKDKWHNLWKLSISTKRNIKSTKQSKIDALISLWITMVNLESLLKRFLMFKINCLKLFCTKLSNLFNSSLKWIKFKDRIGKKAMILNFRRRLLKRTNNCKNKSAECVKKSIS